MDYSFWGQNKILRESDCSLTNEALKKVEVAANASTEKCSLFQAGPVFGIKKYCSFFCVWNEGMGDFRVGKVLLYPRKYFMMHQNEKHACLFKEFTSVDKLLYVIFYIFLTF